MVPWQWISVRRRAAPRRISSNKGKVMLMGNIFQTCFFLNMKHHEIRQKNADQKQFEPITPIFVLGKAWYWVLTQCRTKRLSWMLTCSIRQRSANAYFSLRFGPPISPAPSAKICSNSGVIPPNIIARKMDNINGLKYVWKKKKRYHLNLSSQFTVRYHSRGRRF